MVEAWLVLLLTGVIILAIFLSPLLTAWRRQRLKQRDFPSDWVKIIAQNIVPYRHLSPSQQQQLREDIQVLLAEKQFIGCGGLYVTEEVKLLIIAQACLLLLNQNKTYFPKLRSILVYPNAYVVKQNNLVSHSVIEERQVIRLGESWSKDQVVLSWQQIQQDLQSWQDGRNLVLHEFAHQLDSEDGSTDGVPILPKKTDYKQWATVMQQEYQQLQEDVTRGRKTVMDAYGATAPPEFFSVATETFFEKPKQMQRKHPALYSLLQDYYQLNPVQWY
jgi:Mlc titration factor MtfA (ptsG expression regulator)